MPKCKLVQVLRLQDHPQIRDGSLSIVADWMTKVQGRFCLYYTIPTPYQWPMSARITDTASLQNLDRGGHAEHNLQMTHSRPDHQHAMFNAFVRSVLYLGVDSNRRH